MRKRLETGNIPEHDSSVTEPPDATSPWCGDAAHHDSAGTLRAVRREKEEITRRIKEKVAQRNALVKKVLDVA